MKLHLPVFLRKSLLSCLSAFIVCTVGSGAAWAEAQNLTFSDSFLTWDTQSESFVNEEGNAAAFAEGDNVSFTGESDVALGQDITAGTVAIEQGAAVAIDLDVFELNVDRIELSGSLDVGDSLHIGEGTTLAVQSAGAVLDSNLVLEEKGGFEVGAAASLNYNTLTLQGNTSFTLTAAGDGKTYTLLTGVSDLLDAQGNAISLDDTNNAASLYFDATQPGTGFWANGTLQLNNGALQMVLHNEAVKEAITITTRQDNPAAYQYYAGVRFENISSSADGGAIYGGSDSLITLSNNGSVIFSGNRSSCGDGGGGGAIYGGDNSTIMLSNNGSVIFSGNMSSYGDGGGGGAIYGRKDSTIMLSNNDSVTFSGNTASTTDSSGDADGGAICGDSITLNNNGIVMFEGNTASATDDGFAAGGGAIFGGSTITLNNNGSVVFEGNTASTDEGPIARGGAIDGAGIMLSNNGSVVFEGNMASAIGSVACSYGGAIYGAGIMLSNNGSVTFSGNMARSTSLRRGGAICTAGDLSIRNNDSVEFYQNAEVFYQNAELVDGSYRLRSIYAESNNRISLSAAAGKSITFRDSVYIASGSTVNLNEDYTYLDEAGVSVTVKQQGDIIFTGATTVDDLYDVKGNVAGTEAEIRLSRTTEVNALTNLYGGRLHVEEGAIYQGQGITAHAGSDATVLVKDATLSHSGYDLTFNAGTTLELAGVNSITGNVQMLEDSWLAFDGTESKGMSWLTGNLSFTGGANVSLSGNTDWSGQNEILMYVDGSVSGWEENTLSIRNGAGSTADLRLVNGDLLVLNYNAETFKPYFKGDLTITTRQTDSVNYRYYNSVSFEKIKVDGASSSDGGAISGVEDSFITLNNNGSVEFIGNRTESAVSDAEGGAIYGGGYSTITLSDNGSVVFNGNRAESADSGACGGAIYGDNVTLNNNGSVEFIGNGVASRLEISYISVLGGAIYGDNVTLNNNGSVKFIRNTVETEFSQSNGGAIYGYGNITLNNNGSVEFRGNGAEFPRTIGGAIDGVNVTLNDNGSVIFSENMASFCGGAIHSTQTPDGIRLSDNGSVKFIGNTVRSTSTGLYAYGGAICEMYGYDNGLMLSDNGSVKFIGNTVESTSTAAYGGAIYISNNLSIRNNDLVEFYQNAEVVKGIYCLRSIYADCPLSEISLSAAAGKSIKFFDSVYIGSGATVNLNADYTYLDDDGVAVTVEQKGDIVFTGATTVDDLYTVKGNVEGTEEEIRLSRTTEVNALTNLYGGRLRVEDGAIYQGQGITAHAGSEATVLVKDATLSHSGYDLTFNAGTTLELAGNNTITGNVQMLEGSTLRFDFGADALSSLTGSLSFEDATTLQVAGYGAGLHELLRLNGSTVSGWNALSFNDGAGESLDAADFAQVGDSLFYRNGEAMNLIWTNAAGDALWNNQSLNWAADGTPYAVSVLQNVIFTAGGNETITMVGNQVVESLTVQQGGQYVLNGNADGTSLTVREAVLMEGNTALTVRGNLEAAAINAQGSLEVTGDLVVAGQLTASSLTLTDATATHTVGGNVTLSGAATVAGSLEVEGSFASGTLQVKSLTADGTVSTGAISSSDNSLTATGNMTTGAVTGDRNELISTGGYVLLRNNAALNGSSNKLNAAHVVQVGTITGVGNELVAGKHVDINGSLNGDENSITCNATVNTTDNAIDISGTIGSATNTADDNALYAVRGNIRTGAITGSGNTLTAQDGNITTGAITGNDNALSAVNGVVTAGAIAGTGNVVTAKSLQAAGMEGASLTLTDATAMNRIDGNVTLSGAATVAGELTVSGSFNSSTLQVKSLTADGSITTGKLTGDSATLTALNGNVELTNEHESLNGNSNVITATGGDVRLTDDMTGSRNIITAKAVDGVGGSILRGNGRALWASIAGQHNELTADGRIELESINQGNNTLIAGGAIVNDGGTISINSINGSTNTLTATNGSIRVGNIGNAAKSDNNRLTAAGHVYVQGQLTGDGNYLESNKAPGDGNSISIWNGINGSGNQILANAGNIAMGGGDLTGDNNTLTSVNGNVSVRNVSGTGNTLSAVNGSITAASIAGAGNVVTARSLTASGGVQGATLTLTDAAAANTIGGNVALSGAAAVAGTLTVNGSFTSGTLQVKSLTASGPISSGKIESDFNTLTSQNGNISLTNSGQSLIGNDNNLSATGGNVNLTDDMIGSRNSITVVAVDGVGGSILSANKWASIVGDTNTLTADADILLESIGSESVAGNNNVLNAGDSITINGTGNGMGINGSGNTLTAGTSITTKKIKGDRNKLTADDITATIVDGSGNELTGTTVDITGELKGSANTIEGNVIHVGTLSGTAQEIISNGVDNAADIAIDIDTLSGTNAVIGVLNDGSLNIDSMTAQTGSGDTGSYITVLKGNVGIGALNTTAENTISVGASYGITVGSGSASNQTWTAGSLAATGADGLTLTDSTVTISGAVESTAELNLEGDTALTATSVQAGTLRLDGADVMLSVDRVVADEVVVDTPANNTAVFNTLVADKVNVTNASSLPDNLSVGGGSVIGELVADKLEVREGSATLGSMAKQTEQELQSIALQKGADLVLQGQTSLSVPDSVAMTAGSEMQIQSGATLQNGAVALSAAPGSAAAQLSSKTGGNLVEMQRDTQFSIHDMLLVNTSISAAEGNTVTISGVQGSENLHLLGGADFSLTFANSEADDEEPVIVYDSPVTGLALAAGSTLTLVMDPTNNDFRDYNLVINMSGFEYEGGILAATGGITDLNAAGIYLGGWLGELLAGQGVVQEGVGNLESPEVPGDSIPTVSYTYNADNNVGMIISIHGLSVPEPTTTTLSLLALAALAMRRRRR